MINNKIKTILIFLAISFPILVLINFGINEINKTILLKDINQFTFRGLDTLIILFLNILLIPYILLIITPVIIITIISLHEYKAKKILKYTILSLLIAVLIHITISYYYISKNYLDILQELNNISDQNIFNTICIYFIEQYNKNKNILLIPVIYILIRLSSCHISLIINEQYFIILYMILFLAFFLYIKGDKFKIKEEKRKRKTINNQIITTIIIILIFLTPIINITQLYNIKLKNYINWENYNDNIITYLNDNTTNTIYIQNYYNSLNNLSFFGNDSLLELLNIQIFQRNYIISINNNSNKLEYSEIYKIEDNPLKFNILEANYFHILTNLNNINGYITNGFIPYDVIDFWDKIHVYMLALNTNKNKAVGFCLSNTNTTTEKNIFINSIFNNINAKIYYLNDSAFKLDNQLYLQIKGKNFFLFSNLFGTTSTTYVNNPFLAIMQNMNGFELFDNEFINEANYFCIKIEVDKNINLLFDGINNSTLIITMNGIILGRYKPLISTLKFILIFDLTYLLIIGLDYIILKRIFLKNVNKKNKKSKFNKIKKIK